MTADRRGESNASMAPVDWPLLRYHIHLLAEVETVPISTTSHPMMSDMSQCRVTNRPQIVRVNTVSRFEWIDLAITSPLTGRIGVGKRT